MRDPEFVAAVHRRSAAADVHAVPAARARAAPTASSSRRWTCTPSVDGTPGDFHLVHLGRARARRRRAGDDRDDLRLGRGADHARLRRALRDEHVGGWKRIVDFVHEHGGLRDRRTARALRAQGLDEADVGGDRRAAARRQLAADRPLAAALRPRQPGAARDDARRHGRRARAVRRRRPAARSRPASTCSSCTWRTATCCRAFLSPLTNAPRRRVRDHARRARPVPARGVRRVPRGVAGGASRCPSGSRRPTGSPAGSRPTTPSRFARMLQEHGCDIVDVSSGQVSPDEQPAYGRSYQTPFADRIRNEVGIPTIAVGAISSYDDVNTIIARRAGRPVRARATAPLRPALDAARRRRAGLHRSAVACSVSGRIAETPQRTGR